MNAAIIASIIQGAVQIAGSPIVPELIALFHKHGVSESDVNAAFALIADGQDLVKKAAIAAGAQWPEGTPV